MHFGAWEGLTHEQILSQEAESYRRWLDAPDQTPIPGGESLTELAARVMKTINQLIEQQRGKTIAVVSHNGPIKIVLCQALDIPWRNLWRIRLDLASLSIVEYYDGSPPGLHGERYGTSWKRVRSKPVGVGAGPRARPSRFCGTKAWRAGAGARPYE